MRGGAIVGGLGIVMLVSGCAGGQTRQQLTRLQSQVGMLDERVSQLERTGNPSLSDAMGFGSTGTEAAPAAATGNTAASPAGSSQYTKPSTRQVQTALKNAGFYQGSVDGKMGPLTHDAIKEFQRVHGLTDDGVVGRKTWAKLKSYAELTANSAAGESASTVVK